MKKILTLIIIGIVCLGIGTFVGIKIYKNMNQHNDILDKEKIKEELLGYFSYFGGCNYGIELDFTKKSKLYYSDLDDEVIYNILYNYLTKNNLMVKDSKNEYGVFEYHFSKKNLEASLLNVLGISAKNNFKLSNKFYMGVSEYTLNEKTKIYASSNTPPTGCTPGLNQYYLYDYELVDNTFYLDFVYYYSDVVSDEKNSEEKPFNVAFNPKDLKKYICKSDEIVNYLDKFEKYRYNFKLENKHFILDYIEKID